MANSLEPSARTNLFAPIIFTLIGAGITAFVGWLSAHESAKETANTACVARLDEREKLFREKSDPFLAALGGFIANSTQSKDDHSPEAISSAKELIKAGYVISAYAGPELSLRSVKTSSALTLAMSSTATDAERKQGFDASTNELHEWPNEFLKEIKSIDDARKTCGK